MHNCPHCQTDLQAKRSPKEGDLMKVFGNPKIFRNGKWVATDVSVTPEETAAKKKGKALAKKSEFTLDDFKKRKMPPAVREFRVTIPTPTRGSDIHRTTKYLLGKRLSNVIGLGRPWYRNYKVSEASANPVSGEIVIKLWDVGPPEPKK